MGINYRQKTMVHQERTIFVYILLKWMDFMFVRDACLRIYGNACWLQKLKARNTKSSVKKRKVKRDVNALRVCRLFPFRLPKLALWPYGGVRKEPVKETNLDSHYTPFLSPTACLPTFSTLWSRWSIFFQLVTTKSLVTAKGRRSMLKIDPIGHNKYFNRN
jgi:hypothetical protein